jgi:hypothetical protein
MVNPTYDPLYPKSTLDWNFKIIITTIFILMLIFSAHDLDLILDQPSS